MLAKLNRRLSLAAQVLLNGQLPAEKRREIPAITPQEVTEVKEFFPMDKYFILGHARSGTTLLVRLVRLHPQVHCNYQAHFFTRPPLLQSLVDSREIEAWLARRSNRWNQGRDLSPLVLRAVSDFIMERDARREGKSIVGDKSPSSLLDGQSVRLMHKVYPDGKLIYIVRDGRDTVVSHRFQTFIDASQHLPHEDLELREAFTQAPEPFIRGERSIFTEKAIRRAAEGWARNVTETDQVARELYGDRYHCLRYDHLLARPFDEMQRVWAFLGAGVEIPDLAKALDDELSRNPDADWQVQKAGDLIEPLEKGKQGSWRRLFTPRDREIFKSIAGEALVAWGFEPDLDW